MKKILITGANSYIGTSFEKWVAQWPDKYSVDTVDMVDGSWRQKDFSKYDVVLHVAGIAHIKETVMNADLYYKVNRDLVVETATKAKAEGVEQFIFLSSMSVYGIKFGIITKDTAVNPSNHYGKSKLQAEERLVELQDETFSVTLLRPPMVYGKNCKGNFRNIIKLVKKLPVFPKINNQRSVIYIDNLCSFIKLCIDEELQGLFFPQNKEYVRTVDMAAVIARSINKKLHMSIILGIAVKLCMPFLSIAQKGFGSLVYSGTEDFNFSYCVIDNEESISMSV